MDEQNIVTENNQSSGFSLQSLILMIRRRLALILAVVILATAGGVVYAYMQAPSFTAGRKITITVQGYDDVLGGTKNNVNSMVAYIDTIIDFCDEGVVLDRANYYYKEYANAKEKGNCTDVDNFLERIQQGVIKDGYISGVTAVEEQYIKAKDLAIVNLGDKLETQFAFNIKYTDGNKVRAYEKASLVFYAYKKELQAVSNDTGISEMKYFGGIEVFANDLGSLGVGSNTSKVKTVALFVIIGAVLGFVFAYAIHLLDNTVTSKHELERLTGTPVLSWIDN